jgi:CspA family cold shock protein
MEKTRIHGETKMWEPGRGFGFLRPDGGDADVFCHVSQLANGMQALGCGERVTFSIRPGQKGPMAQNVELEEK